MSLYLGIDTSAYCSSVAVFDSANGQISEFRRLLEVKPGERGLRQSEAFFQHINNLPGLFESLLKSCASGNLRAVGASLWPRRVEGSYMPVFRAGAALASIAGQMRDLAMYGFSHQEGHLFSGLYEYPEILLGAPFMGVHYSGGTSEILAVYTDPDTPVKIEILNSSSDLKAGQLIDRVGVRLGFSFPAGPEMEKLAAASEWSGTNPFRKATGRSGVSFSGAETRAYRLLDEGLEPCDLARMLFEAIAAELADAILSSDPQMRLGKILLAGGVMANGIIRECLVQRLAADDIGRRLYFTSPRLSSDNASGIAYLTYLVDSGALPAGDTAVKGMSSFGF